MKLRTLAVPVVTAIGGLLIGLAGTSGAAVQAPATVSVPSYCTSGVTVVRSYAYTVPANADSFRSGIAGHGGKLKCVTVYGGNYAKTLEWNTATGGWVIPFTGINALYVNCCGPTSPCTPQWPQPGYRWSPTGLPNNDCAEQETSSTITTDGGLRITWPLYNGTQMFPPTTPNAP